MDGGGAPGDAVRRTWPWLLAVLGPLLLLATLLGVWLSGVQVDFGPDALENLYPNVVFGAIVPLLGALVLSRFPRHPLGLLFLATGLASAVTLVVYPYARSAQTAHPLPGALAAAWVSDWIWTMGLMPLITVGILLFPDGRVVGRWRRVVLALDVAMIALNFVAHAFRPGPLDNSPFFTNPLGVPLPRPVFDAVGAVAFGCFVAGFFGGLASVLLRWRRATGTERAQLRWFAFAAALLPLVALNPWHGAFAAVLALVAIPLLPASVAVAIVRHRLYGIDLVVRRSLSYTALTAVLLLLYALVVSGVGVLVHGRVPAVVATVLVAIAFAPLRDRLQRAVDRLLYGEGHDPYAVLTGLGRRLETADSTPLAEAVASIAASLRLPFVRVEVDGDLPMAAEQGTPTADAHVVPLTYRGEPLGRLLAAPRSPRDPFRPADLRLLDDLGRQLGVTAHAARLAVELQRSREGLVSAREEERRRIRRDLHDGLGPALAGVALGLDAVARLAPEEPGEAAALADQLKREVHGSLADVRRLVEDLRPPALDQLGLVGAVRQQARILNDRDPGLEVAVEAGHVGALPAAVEVAAYRIATEALTNVSRHAAARHCRVGLQVEVAAYRIATEALTNVSRHAAARHCRVGLKVEAEYDGAPVLLLEVEDDGVGLNGTRRAGVGLSAMHERASELGGTCESGPATLGGTRVSARLPLGVA